jgi:hypothetical protein
VFVAGGSVSLANSTFFANAANNGGSGGFPDTGGIGGNGGNSAGGGLFVAGGSVDLVGLTIASNQAGGGGAGGPGGFGSASGASGSSLGGGICNSGATSLVSDSTLIGNNTQDTASTGGGLQQNGGPTETVALEDGSPAIDAGDNVICQAPPPEGLGGVDQRGFPRSRPGDPICDIGAFEFVDLTLLPLCSTSGPKSSTRKLLPRP